MGGTDWLLPGFVHVATMHENITVTESEIAIDRESATSTTR